MRVKLLAISALLIMSAAPAQAGSCSQSAHCTSVESGVTVYRGQHTPAISQRALALRAEQQRQAQAARELAAIERLNRAVQQQTTEIASLRAQVAEGQRAQAQRPRRRTYYGNPAFFGRNGFIGNRFFGGGTIQPTRPRRPRRRPRPIK